MIRFIHKMEDKFHVIEKFSGYLDKIMTYAYLLIFDCYCIHLIFIVSFCMLSYKAKSLSERKRYGRLHLIF